MQEIEFIEKSYAMPIGITCALLAVGIFILMALIVQKRKAVSGIIVEHENLTDADEETLERFKASQIKNPMEGKEKILKKFKVYQIKYKDLMMNYITLLMEKEEIMEKYQQLIIDHNELKGKYEKLNVL